MNRSSEHSGPERDARGQTRKQQLARRNALAAVVSGLLLVIAGWLVDIAFHGEVPGPVELYTQHPAHLVLLLVPGVLGFFAFRLTEVIVIQERPAPRMSKESLQRSLRASEHGARAVMENVLDGIVVLTDEGIIQDVNPSVERMFGYSKYELIGKEFKLLVPKHGEPDSAISTFRRNIKNEIMGVEWQMEGVHSDGTEVPLELSFNAVDTGEGRLFIYLLRDITGRLEEEERRQHIADELSAARDHALAASRSKSIFLASVSHELRTPLNAILGYGEMLQEDLRDRGEEALSNDVAKIHSAGRHLLEVINTILDLSKIEAGRMEIYRESFPVTDLVRDVVETIQPLAEKNGNQLVYEVADDVVHLYSDLTKVRQALFNLISNANKFTSDGEVRVEVTRRVQSDEALIQFQVTDTGIGLSPEQVERLFQEFTQAHADTYRQYGGTGLGLAITKRFANMLQGDVTVTSEEGEGSTFTLTIPERMVEPDEELTHTPRPAPDRDEPASEETAPPAAHEAPPGVGTILVIDDDPTVRDLLQRFLSREGFHVVSAAGGKEGLQLARELRPTAITLDVMMPEMDGWSVLSQLKADDGLAEIPVLMLTMVADRSMGYALGATDYLSKPIDRTRLATVLARYRCASPPCPVLVVEDEDDIREMMARMLSKEGWRAVEARNGLEALERIEENVPALILLDLMMPEMDGFQFLQELRAKPHCRNIPVVVVTAAELSNEEQQRLDGSVQSILHKGHISQDELLTAVRSSVDEAINRRRPFDRP